MAHGSTSPSVGSQLAYRIQRRVLVLMILLQSVESLRIAVRVAGRLQSSLTSTPASFSMMALQLQPQQRQQRQRQQRGLCYRHRFHGPDLGTWKSSRHHRSFTATSFFATKSRRSGDSNDPLPAAEITEMSSPLDDIETTVDKVLRQWNDHVPITDIYPVAERQAVGVARHIRKRLTSLEKNKDCRTCWLQQAHCVCLQTVPCEKPVANLRKIYLIYHHKEIGLAVDTAKLLWRTLPAGQVRIVVGGIPAHYQESAQELEQVLLSQSNRTLVLFPDETAVTWNELEKQETKDAAVLVDNVNDADYGSANEGYNVIVLDGTWEQARKLYQTYIPDPSASHGGPIRVQLESEDLDRIVSSNATGRQLRRHPVVWREIGTIAAVRSLLQSMDSAGRWEEKLAAYQQTADAAARAQLGSPRTKQSVAI